MLSLSFSGCERTQSCSRPCGKIGSGVYVRRMVPARVRKNALGMRKGGPLSPRSTWRKKASARSAAETGHYGTGPKHPRASRI